MNKSEISPIRVMSQYLSGSTRGWVCFVDEVLFLAFLSPRGHLRAILVLIPNTLFMLNLFRSVGLCLITHSQELKLNVT